MNDDLRWYDDVSLFGGVDLTLWLRLIAAVLVLAVAGIVAL